VKKSIEIGVTPTICQTRIPFVYIAKIELQIILATVQNKLLRL
jgi:hypothetical protein